MSTKTFAVTFALLIVACATSHAQNTSGTLGGRVLDPTGAVVPNAEVHATNVATSTVASARTNASGIYEIAFLPPGIYDVSVEMPGFKRVARMGIELRVNDALNIELNLQVGNAAETVEVSAAAPLVESETASEGQVVQQQQIQNLPLQAGNAAELTLFAPGVVNTTNLRARKTSFNSASSQFVTDGSQLYSNEYAIDGVPDTFASGNTPLVAFQPPQFAVSEFRVQTSAYDAAVGHTTGAVINLVSNSGANQVHGELHEWFSNSYLDAPTFFQNRAGLTKPEYQDNRYGASLGGPVLLPKLYNGRNKTFFFYAWESNQWGKPVTTVGTVPTDAERNGDFSALLKLGSSYQIYDPATTVALANGRYQRQPFAGNIIPAGRIDPLARKILSYYAEPNTAGTSAGQNNYTQSIKDTFDYYVHFVRLDHYFSDKNRMFVRFDYDHYFETDPGFYNNESGGINLTRINRGAALDDVLVLSSHTILDLRYGLTQEEAPEQRISSGINLGKLGFSPALTSLLNPQNETFPQIYLNTKASTKSCPGACTGTYSGFGNFNNGDGTTTGLIHQFAGTFNTLKGSHDLHYGAEFRLYRSFGFNGGFDVSPQYQFLPTYTNGPLDNSPVASIGQELAALELGIPSTGQMTRSASFAIQNTYEGWFLQDNWKVRPGLTLNFGLRMEHESPVTERYGRSVRGFDATDANPIATQAAANYAKSPASLLPVSSFRVLGGLQFASGNGQNLWSQPGVTVLPRIGAAWQVDKKTVLRSGFGIYYDTIGVNRSPAIQSGFTSSTPIIPSYDNGQTFVASLANPFPNGLLPGVGSAGGLTTFLGQALSFYPTNRLQPLAQRWSGGIQRVVAKSFLIDASYVGNKSIHLPVSRNINATPLQYLSTSPLRDQTTITRLSAQVSNPFYGLNPVFPSTINVADLLRPYPEFGDIVYTDNNGYSWYHALQIRGEKRFAHGYAVNVAYTWSKFMDATGYLNDGDPKLNRTISQYDRPQRVVISGIWELPVGRGRTYFSGINRGLDAVVGGWQLNGSMAQQSGSALGFGDAIYYGTIDQIALPADQRTVDQWFDTSLFERSSSKQRQYDVRTFPKSFAGIRGPGQSQVNVSLFKNFKFGERWNLQFRAECYDLLNHPNFNDPNTTVTSSSFGAITAQGSPSRQFQGALKLSF